MDVGAQASNSLLPQPGSHEPGSFLGKSLSLMADANDPGELGDGSPAAFDCRLQRADGITGGAVADRPVQPALTSIGRAPNDLALEASSQILHAGRLAANEVVQRVVSEYRRELLPLLGPQRLENESL